MRVRKYMMYVFLEMYKMHFSIFFVIAKKATQLDNINPMNAELNPSTSEVRRTYVHMRENHLHMYM